MLPLDIMAHAWQRQGLIHEDYMAVIPSILD
jgi:hypothetical protein